MVQFPELVKATIMASSVGRPVGNQYQEHMDTKSGFGIPDANLANLIASNRYYANDGTAMNGPNGSASFSFPSGDGNGSKRTFYITLNGTPNSYVHFIVTWFSNPEGTCTSGSACFSDDLDMTVTIPPTLWALSYGNTTERLIVPQGSGGMSTYKVEVTLPLRVTNKTIWGALAWADVLNPGP